MSSASRGLRLPSAPECLAVVARAGYGIAVGVAGMLLALLVITLWGPTLDNGETWEALGIGWIIFGGPAALVGILLSSAVVFPLYQARRSWVAAAAIFVFNVVAIAAFVLGLAAWAAGLLVFAS